MTLKTILDVEVNDEDFLRFKERFSQYEAQLSKMPKEWATAGEEGAKLKSSFEAVTAAMMIHAELSARMGKSQKDTDRTSFSISQHWLNLSRSTRKVASDIAGITLDIAKVGAFGLLGLGGGLWGIGHLAGTAAEGRRSALGRDVTFGEQASFGANFSRLVEPGAFLSSVNSALHDVTQRAALYGAGFREPDLRGKNTGQVSEELLPKLKELADNTSDAMLAQTLTARHLDQFISLEDFQRLKATPWSEMNELRQRYLGNVGPQGLTPVEQKAWADFQTQLHNAGNAIETTFERGLMPLAGPLADLSKGFSDASSAFLASPLLKEWIVGVGESLEKFAGYLRTPEFESDVRNFVENVKSLAASTRAALEALGIISPSSGEAGSTSTYTTPDGQRLTHQNLSLTPPDSRPLWQRDQRSAWDTLVGATHNPGNIKALPGQPSDSRGFAAFPNDREGFLALRNQLLRDQYVHHQDSLMKLIYGNAEWAGYSTTDRKAYLSNLMKATGKGANDKINLSDQNEMLRVMAAITRQEKGARGEKYTPEVIVTIINSTGSDVTTQTTQAAH